jgi:tetratricopeptide (TPR) repeat protein
MAESQQEEIAKLEALYADNPGGRVFVHLAEAYRKAGEPERAREILREGLSRHPDAASGLVVLGRVLADVGESAESAAAYRRVLELDGGNLVALRALADLARDAGRLDEARVHYGELLLRNPSSDDVRSALAELAEFERSPGSDAEVPPVDATVPEQDRGELGRDLAAEEAASPAGATAYGEPVETGPLYEPSPDSTTDDVASAEFDSDLHAAPAFSGAGDPDVAHEDIADQDQHEYHAPDADEEGDDAPAEELPLTSYDDAWRLDDESADATPPSGWGGGQRTGETVSEAPAGEPSEEFGSAAPSASPGETGDTVHPGTDFVVADAAALPGDLALLAGLDRATAERFDDPGDGVYDEMAALDLAAMGEPELDLDTLRESLAPAEPHGAGDTGLILAATPLDPDVFDTSELLDLVTLQTAPDSTAGDEEEGSPEAGLNLPEERAEPIAEPHGEADQLPFAGAADELEIVEALIEGSEAVGTGPDQGAEAPPPWLAGRDRFEPEPDQEPEPEVQWSVESESESDVPEPELEPEPEVQWSVESESESDVPEPELEPEPEVQWSVESETESDVPEPEPEPKPEVQWSVESESESDVAEPEPEPEPEMQWSVESESELDVAEPEPEPEMQWSVESESELDVAEQDLDDDRDVLRELAAGVEVPSEVPSDDGELPVLPGREMGPAADVSGLETETMAELYLRQGFRHRAISVYEALLRRRPDDERLITRLREILASSGPSAPESTNEAEDDAGDDWLRQAGTTWVQSGASVADDSTPYAWVADQPEDEESTGPAISAYLQQLVSWRASAEASADRDVEAEATEVMPWQPEWDPTLSQDAGVAAADEPAVEAPAEVAGSAQLPAAESAHGRSNLDPVEAAFNEWYGVPEPKLEAPATNEAEDDDEDLAMFRSWLQSLKK